MLMFVLLVMFASSAQAQQPVVTLEAVDSFDSELFVALVKENAESTQFHVKLSTPSTETVNVLFATKFSTYDGYDIDNSVYKLGLCFNLSLWDTNESCRATPGSDYYGVAEEVTFEPGETQKTVAVQILDNRYAELNQVFDAVLFRPDNAVLPRRVDGRSAAQWSVFIEDDDVSPTGSVISLDIPSNQAYPAVFDEGAGIIETRVRLSPASPLSVEVTVYTNSSQATEGVDYEGIPRQRLVFQPGETTKPIPIEIYEDSIVEDNEELAIQLVQPVGARLNPLHPEFGSPYLLIVDNDQVPTIGFSSRPVTVQEFSPIVRVTVLADEYITRPITAFVYTRSTGSALPGSDFYGVAQRIQLIPNSGSFGTSFDIPILNDQVAESSESFEVHLVNAENASIRTSTLTVFINDDDR